MKYFAISALVIAFCAFCASGASNSAWAGHGEGNGGDGYVQEVVTIANQVQAFLKANPDVVDPAIDAALFKKAIDATDFSSVDDVLYLNGVPKDLVNYPRDHKIVISRPRWRSEIDSMKNSLVTHEILGIMSAMGSPLDDRKYDITSKILIAARMNTNAPIASSDSNVSREIEKWCRDSAGVLRQALATGYQAKTSAEEKTILLASIDAALATGPSRLIKFFSATLDAAEADILSFPNDTAEQVNVLRSYVQFAIDDVSTFDNRNNDPNDNGPYVQTMLSRSVSQGMMSKTNEEELNLLGRAAQRGILLIDTSDFRRTGKYACLRQKLMDALAIASDDSLSLQTQVLLLRSALGSAATQPAQCNPSE